MNLRRFDIDKIIKFQNHLIYQKKNEILKLCKDKKKIYSLHILINFLVFFLLCPIYGCSNSSTVFSLSGDLEYFKANLDYLFIF